MSARVAGLGRHSPALVRCGQVLFRFRNAIFPAILLALLVLCRPYLAGGSVLADRWLDAAGWLVVVAGLVLRGWVIGLQYIKRGGSAGKVYAEGLVTGGVFACSRNPLYVGNGLLLVGQLMILNNPVVYVVAIPLLVFVYQAIVAAEEAYLADEYGQAYRAYCGRVNRWLPNPAGLVNASRGQSFDWPRVVGADYNTACISLVTGLAVMAYERLNLSAYGATWAGLAWLWAGIAAVCVLYLVARAMKKKGMLGQR